MEPGAAATEVGVEAMGAGVEAAASHSQAHPLLGGTPAISVAKQVWVPLVWVCDCTLPTSLVASATSVAKQVWVPLVWVCDCTLPTPLVASATSVAKQVWVPLVWVCDCTLLNPLCCFSYECGEASVSV